MTSETQVGWALPTIKALVVGNAHPTVLKFFTNDLRSPYYLRTVTS
ncbi:hypothetical protein [Scytonema sp. NUACC26]